MEKHHLGDEWFHRVNQYLRDHGMQMNRGTIVGARIIHAPSSTQNKKKQRDPDMHQTRKGNPWSFGMKAHIGVDSRSKIIHSVVATAANVHDSTVLADLLHGEETRVWGDSAYAGQKKVLAQAAPNARDWTQTKGGRHRKLTDEERARNRRKSRVRAKVEHPFGILKRPFGFTQGPLPRASEKCSSSVDGLRPEQSGDGQKGVIAQTTAPTTAKLRLNQGHQAHT